MYAVFSDGGRQYKVQAGEELEIDYRGLPVGQEIKFDQVLTVIGDAGAQIGRPTVAGAAVIAEVVGTAQGPKLVVQKFRRRKNFRRKTGHRQLHTRVKINKIETA